LTPASEIRLRQTYFRPMLHDAATFPAELVSGNLKLKHHPLRYSPKSTIENSNALLANDRCPRGLDSNLPKRAALQYDEGLPTRR